MTLHEQQKQEQTENKNHQEAQLEILSKIDKSKKIVVKTEAQIGIVQNKSVIQRPETLTVLTCYGASVFTYWGSEKSEIIGTVGEKGEVVPLKKEKEEKK